MTYKHKNFSGNEINGQDFEDSVFEHCNFLGDIRFAGFLKCKFVSCDLSGALFNTTHFTNCSFPGSKLSNIDFSDVNIENCNFSGSVMENCIFKKKKKFNLKSNFFEDTNLQRSVFVFCDLTKMKFSGSDLTGTVFERCDLTETNFTGAKLNGTNFEDCKIAKTILDLNGFLSFGSSKGFVLEES